MTAKILCALFDFQRPYPNTSQERAGSQELFFGAGSRLPCILWELRPCLDISATRLPDDVELADAEFGV